mgnify:CR=1 FL=1
MCFLLWSLSLSFPECTLKEVVVEMYVERHTHTHTHTHPLSLLLLSLYTIVLVGGEVCVCGQGQGTNVRRMMSPSRGCPSLASQHAQEPTHSIRDTKPADGPIAPGGVGEAKVDCQLCVRHLSSGPQRQVSGVDRTLCVGRIPQIPGQVEQPNGHRHQPRPRPHLILPAHTQGHPPTKHQQREYLDRKTHCCCRFSAHLYVHHTSSSNRRTDTLLGNQFQHGSINRKDTLL